MKNKLIILIITFFFFNSISFSEIYKFETSNIEILENGNLIRAVDGKVISSNNDLELKAEKFIYNKDKGILKAIGNGLAFFKSQNLKIKFDNALIDEKKFSLIANGNVKISQIKDEIYIETEIITYDRKKQIIKSNTKSKLNDKYKNEYNVDSFFYEINKDLLKLVNANFKDTENNKLKTSIAFINIKTNKLVGKDIHIDLSDKNFNSGNEPRMKGNSVVNDNEYTEITKGVFTTCKKTDKCPPWKLSAEKIQHDKKNKNINYKNAVLSLYDLPVMYFPRFFHPDPTVKRRSGFLIPTFKNSPTTDNYLNLPYFLAIAGNKDATLSPRFYTDDKILLQTEYRQVNSKSNHISDFSVFSEKDKSTKNHFFYNYAKSFDYSNFETSNINLEIQQTSNDTYLKANKINSPILDDNNVLENSLEMSLSSNDLTIDTEITVYEDLNKGESDRFEYILPKFNFIKKIDSNNSKYNGDFSFRSQNLVRNYNTNILEKTNINDLIFSSVPKINKKGFYNNYDFLIKNSNTDTKNSKNFKENENYYVSGILQINSALPLIKENDNYQKILKPKFSFKIAPTNTKDIRNKESVIDVNNIYSLNRISENDTIEGGISLSYGNDYTIFNKSQSREIFSFKLANNVRLNENQDLPRNNQIGQKISSIFSEFAYSPSEYLTAKYNTSIKNNLSDINYESLITELKFNKLVTSFDYLNENNTQDKNSYITNTTTFFIDEFNNLKFSTRENKTSDLTEYYNLMYQYRNDCLAASIEYNKDYYNDRDIKPDESIMFKLTIIPFGESSSPNLMN